MRYLRADVSHFELKKMRRGDYSPELFLDLHGLTQQQAKQELGALIAACRREHVFCACVMHGHGKHILKQQTPLWLAQHPHVMAFHQAPKEYGGDAALLLLIEVEESEPPNFPDAEKQKEPHLRLLTFRMTAVPYPIAGFLNRFCHFQVTRAHLPVKSPLPALIKRYAGNR